jgi:DNA-binding NarL/FixJ family response regulator
VAVAALLRSLPAVARVDEVGSAEELAAALRRSPPDAFIVDDRLLGERGLGPRDAALPFVVMGLDDDPHYARRAQHLGAIAWIAKERADELLPAALDQARARIASRQPPA